MYLLFRIIDDECNPKNDDLGSESPEDEEDFKLRIPEVEELSDDEMKTAEGVDEIVNRNIKAGILNPLGITYVHMKTMSIPVVTKARVSFFSEMGKNN